MKTVSLQGIQLSPGQRRILEQQRHVRAFMNPILTQQVAETLAVVEKQKEQGLQRWVDPNKFNIVQFKAKGTPSMAEWMGY